MAKGRKTKLTRKLIDPICRMRQTTEVAETDR